ncbi:hypothetical protein ISG33_02660 [Glaciecola sp. MH2013]|uniref:hypothetical protein n=1 Tax=Glaciecola sp. MH2013 TaxID=2785524 RepID=UPI00189E0A4D|nr:hypothetical protein [Glaciecola sp. MH2013]MBF7072304.1 hypothetical protein [Glaciecola sp. MH2013]
MNVKLLASLLLLNVSSFAISEEEDITERIQGLWIQDKSQTYSDHQNEMSELSEALKLCVNDESCGANVFEFNNKQVTVFIAVIENNKVAAYEKLGPFDFTIKNLQDSSATLSYIDDNAHEQTIRFEGKHLIFVHDYFDEFLIKTDISKLDRVSTVIN